MTLEELGVMLATVSTQKMGEILTMEKPVDRSTEIGESISALTKRVSAIEDSAKEAQKQEVVEDAEQTTTEYFASLI